MKRNNALFIILSVLLLLRLPVDAQFSTGMESGTGARALAFANNHTAAVNNISAVYWNPAALAYMPVREVQMSLDAMRIYGTSEIEAPYAIIPPGANMSANRDRIRLGSFGAMSAMPTVQGGLTIAAFFDRPYMFDDFTVFHYERFGESVRLDGRRYGDLNRWSGAFGIQVAPKAAVGLTLSIVSGTERAPIIQDIRFQDEHIFPEDYYDVEYQNKFLGYILTFGTLVCPLDNLKLGARLNAASDVRLRETMLHRETPETGDRKRTKYTDSGRAYIAPSGAFGAEFKLPWLITAFDLRVTMPYTFSLPTEDSERMPDDIQAKYFKLGTGIGFEAPLPVAPIVLRAGYSFDEHDLIPMIYKYDDSRINWEEEVVGGFWPAPNRHSLGLGIGVFTSGIGLEFSYVYRIWGVTTENLRGVSFRQAYSSHRVVAGVTYRY